MCVCVCVCVCVCYVLQASLIVHVFLTIGFVAWLANCTFNCSSRAHCPHSLIVCLFEPLVHVRTSILDSIFQSHSHARSNAFHNAGKKKLGMKYNTTRVPPSIDDLPEKYREMFRGKTHCLCPGCKKMQPIKRFSREQAPRSPRVTLTCTDCGSKKARIRIAMVTADMLESRV